MTYSGFHSNEVCNNSCSAYIAMLSMYCILAGTLIALAAEILKPETRGNDNQSS